MLLSFHFPKQGLHYLEIIECYYPCESGIMDTKTEKQYKLLTKFLDLKKIRKYILLCCTASYPLYLRIHVLTLEVRFQCLLSPSLLSW